MIDGISSDFHLSLLWPQKFLEIFATKSSFDRSEKGETFWPLWNHQKLPTWEIRRALKCWCSRYFASKCPREKQKAKSRTFQLLFRDFFIINFSHYSTAVNVERQCSLCIFELKEMNVYSEKFYLFFAIFIFKILLFFKNWDEIVFSALPEF